MRTLIREGAFFIQTRGALVRAYPQSQTAAACSH